MALGEGGAEEDDMGAAARGSLFDGMVLFTPANLSSTTLPPTPSPSPPPSPPPPPPPAVSPSSVPLDEDLFSDLTVQTPDPDPPPPPTPTPSPLLSPSRQSSRKKKRATVRIGYARDSNAPEEEPLHPPRSPPILNEATLSSPLEEPPPPPPQPAASPASHPSSVEDNHHRPFNAEAAPPPSSPKEDSFGSEEKLVQVRAQISQKLDRLRVVAASLSAERKALRRRRRKAAEDLSLAAAMYKDLEKELEEACEAEDFERAEMVSETLAAAEREKVGFVTTLKEAEEECEKVDAKMQEVLELQIQSDEEGAALLEQFAKDAAENADILFRKAEETSLKELEEWYSLMELLEIRRLELDIKSHLINEARAGLEHSIEELADDDRKEREILRRKRDILVKELDELLASVQMKVAEIADMDSQIHEVDKRISVVVSGCHGTQSSIEVKYNDLQSALSEIDMENAELLRKKTEIDDFISIAEQKRLKLRELASVFADEAKTCHDMVGLRKSLASSVLKSREDKVRLAKTEERISEDTNILRHQISAARNSLQELSSTRASIQQDIASHRQRVSYIDKRGPELEAEKKVAAAARNFKEAGRIAAVAKALNVEKESLKDMLEKAVSDLQKLDQEIKDTLEEIQDNEELILSKEKEAATASYERLWLVAASARAERTAALELDDSDEADILLQEVEAAECKARELQEAYSLEPKEDGKILENFVSMVSITNLAVQHLTEVDSSFNLSVPGG